MSMNLVFKDPVILIELFHAGSDPKEFLVEGCYEKHGEGMNVFNSKIVHDPSPGKRHDIHRYQVATFPISTPNESHSIDVILSAKWIQEAVSRLIFSTIVDQTLFRTESSLSIKTRDSIDRLSFGFKIEAKNSLLFETSDSTSIKVVESTIPILRIGKHPEGLFGCTAIGTSLEVAINFPSVLY